MTVVMLSLDIGANIGAEINIGLKAPYDAAVTGHSIVTGLREY